MPAPIGPATGVTPAAPATPAAATPGTPDKDMFLQLMVAQLRYQNPLQPTDSTQFMTQTAQFAMLETMQKLADLGEQTDRWTRMSLAQDLIGKTVEVTDPATGEPVESTVTRLRATDTGPLLTITTSAGDREVTLDDITGIHDRS